MPSTIQYLFVPDTTWFLYFDFDVPDKIGFDITKLPLELKVHELTRTGQWAIFKLGIVSLLSIDGDQDHHAALMTFNNKWFHYDNALGGELKQVVFNPFPFIINQQLRIGIFYFRKPNVAKF